MVYHHHANGPTKNDQMFPGPVRFCCCCSNYRRHVCKSKERSPHKVSVLQSGDSGERRNIQSFLKSLRSACSDGGRFLLAAIGEAMNLDPKFNIVSLLNPFLDEDKHGKCLSPAIRMPTLLRLIICMLTSASEQETDKKNEILVMICATFRAAAMSAHNAQNDLTIEPKFCAEDSKWFERAGYKLVMKKLQTWPFKYTIDLLHWVCEMRGFGNLDRVTEAEGLSVRANAICVQMVCYMAMAKLYTPSWTIEDLPRTSNARNAALQARGLERILYGNVINRFHDLQVLNQQDSNTPTAIEASSWNTRLRKHLTTLLPIAFEARLFIASCDFRTGLPFNQEELKRILNKAVGLHSPRRTYSLLADMILSSILLDVSADLESESSKQATIPTPIALHLLWEIVRAVGKLSECDVKQIARWIRCFVQVGLDCVIKESSSVHLSCTGRQTLDMVDKIGQQVLLLAESGVEEMTRSSLQISSSLYPGEELEWLSITFFNLSVDLLVLESTKSSRAVQAQGSVASSDRQIAFPVERASDSHRGDSPAGGYPRSRIVAETSAAEATPAQPEPITAAGEGDARNNEGLCEDSVTSPWYWARSAIELADLLNWKVDKRRACFQSHAMRDDAESFNDEVDCRDDYTYEGAGYGDGGTLAETLRARCQELGWEL
ncbi:hypothetical protein PV10_03193 [Exophiala mesophila]|uniref:Uncharacterized protein n=1 Tax=Exophiala mesophila TaxID=212818 RepID=A0A0D1X1D2_EXOME|nr:uncharacterized protein PV10_03193 [Exophiala mesophila]KIV95555.1 hypothetical protein PV10_03193 [Exophiala mesophila]